jgi:hypothetical protein
LLRIAVSFIVKRFRVFNSLHPVKTLSKANGISSGRSQKPATSLHRIILDSKRDFIVVQL